MSKHDPSSDHGSCLKSGFPLRLVTGISNEVGQNRQRIILSLAKMFATRRISNLLPDL
jgi:hypothetical protein